jgi:hypothetical protein
MKGGILRQGEIRDQRQETQRQGIRDKRSETRDQLDLGNVLISDF